MLPRGAAGGLQRVPRALGAMRQREVWGGVVLPLLTRRWTSLVPTSSSLAALARKERTARLEEEAERIEQAPGETTLAYHRRLCARRAAARRRAYSDESALPGGTLLEKLLLKSPSRAAYPRLLAEPVNFMVGFRRFPQPAEATPQEAANVQELELLSAEELDALVCECLTSEFFSGAEGPLGLKLLASLACALPGLVRRGQSLPRGRQAAVALRRLAPSHSRLPVPEALVYALAMELCAAGLWIEALAVILSHHGYLRPSELLRLTWAQVCPGVARAGTHVMSLVLHPSEQAVSSKVGEFDESSFVDLKWLEQVLGVLKLERPAQSLVVPHSLAHLDGALGDAAARLGMTSALGAVTMYRFRQSGPSADYALSRPERGTAEPVARRDRGLLARVARRGHVPSARLPECRRSAEDAPYILGLFRSGVQVARAAARQGCRAVGVDVEKGTAFDLRSRDLQRQCRGAIMAHRVLSVHIAPPPYG